MKKLNLFNRSGMGPDGMSRKGRYCLDPILSRLCLVSLICVLMLTLGVGNAWGAVTTYTFTSKAFADATNSWTSNTDGDRLTSGQGVQCTTSKKGKATTKTSRSNVKQVTVIYCTNASSGAGTIKVKIGSNSEQSYTITKSGGTSLRTATFTYATPQSGTISVQGNTSTNSIYIYGVSIITDSGSETCEAIDVTGGDAVVLPGGSTTYVTSAWKNNGSPTAYPYTPVENSIGAGDHCVVFTQAMDGNNANGMQFKEKEGVLLIRHIVSTAGVDISIVCSGTNGFTVELTGATTKTSQTGTVSIETESTDATLVIKKINTSVGYLKTISITPKVSCTAPNHVDITGTNKYLGGQEVSLTATAYSSAGTGSPIDAGDITGYQWQKKIDGVWTNLSNGTVSEVTIAGATTNNLTISPCTHENSGGYRCIVSTGATCSTKSHADGTDGYGVHVFSIYGAYYGGAYSHNEIAWSSSGTTGTATIHLNPSSTYMFKVHSNNGYYYGNGTNNYIIQPVNWDCGTGNSEMRLFTGPEGDYTFTVDIQHGLDGSPYVNVQVGYPSVSHPSTGYVYVTKWWDCYPHMWDGSSNALTPDGSDPQLTTYTSICGTDYWYFPVMDNYVNFAAKDNATWASAGNNTGTQTVTSHGGKYLTHDGSWGWHDFTTYEISFAGNGNSGGSMTTMSDVCPNFNTAITSNSFTKTGYTFAGWKANHDVKNSSGSTISAGTVIDDGTTIQITQDIELTAQWTAKTTTVSFNQNSGTGGQTGTLTATYGSAMPSAPVTCPTRTGYDFGGYYDGSGGIGTQYYTNTGASARNWDKEDATYTLYAKWTAKTTSITLNKNNSDASGSTAGSASWTYDQTTKNSITAATRTGYNVDGYYTAASDGTKILNADGSLAGNSITVDAVVYTSGGKWAYDGTSLTLYAHWTLKTTTVSFNQNSGTGGQTTTKTATYSQAMPTPITTPTRAGYTFTGYFENSGGTGTKYYNADGSSATNWNKENATWTLYAGWAAKEDTYKTALHTGESGWTSYASGVTKSGAGYTIPAPSSVTKGVGSTCEDIHYHFAGWVADDYKGSPSGHIITATGTTDATGTTYWAVWEKEAAGGGGTSSITITRSTTGITATGYGSGVERTWTQSEIDFGGHYIMTNNANTPSGASASQYIVLQKSNGTLYNTEELPGAITEVEVIQYSELACNVYCGDERLMASDNTSTGQTPSGTLITKPDDATTMTWTISASNNYRFFALKAYTSSSSGTNYITSVKVTYSTITYEDPKAVCDACVATPSISGVSLTGSSFSTTSVPVQATGASAGDNCSLASYGFYWGTSASPTTNNTASDNLSTGTFSATLTGTFTIGTTYYYRAYATNEAPNTGYSSDGTFTLQNVTFNMHSHGGDAPATQVVPQGGKATDPGDPSETGYTFDGWWDNSSYTGSAWDFSTNTVGSGGVTLHAKWTEKPKYTITLNAGNGTVTADGWTAGDAPTWTKTQANGDEEITFPAANPGCAGWVFKGWKQGSAADDQGSFTPDKTTGATLTPTSNVTYYAVYRQSTPSGTTYSKITSVGDLATTDYAIIAAFSESGNYYAMKNAKNGTYMQETSFTHADSWTNSDADYIWKVLVFGDKVAFYNADEEKFLTIVNGAWELATDGQFFTYSFNSTTKAWTFSSPSGKQLTYSTQFYVGDSQNKAIYLYKRGEAESGNYFTNPSCSDIAVNGVANPAAGGTVQLTATAAKSGDKVWACYTADEDYNFTNWSISGTGASLSSTSAQFTEITVGSADVTATANFTAKVWRTVTWKANGVTLTGGDLGSASVKVENGHNITILPPTPSSCDAGVGASDQFMGWVVESENWAGKTNDLSEIHIYKRASQFPTVTGNVTYHAVWAASDDTQNAWVKVTDVDDVEAGFKYAVITFDDAYYVGNTDQSSAKPSLNAVTKTSGDINFTSDMEFNATAGPNDGFIFTSAAVSGVKIWGSSSNDGVRVSTSSAAANASDEWFPELDATYGVIMTTSNSKYLCTYSTNDWRNYSSGYNASNRAANLYKYAYGYKNYMTMCCDKEVTIGSITKSGSGEVTFASGGKSVAVGDEVLTCLSDITIRATVTPTNGYQCTALEFTRSDSEDLTPDPAISVPFTGAASYNLTFEQNADGVTLNTTVTFVALIDHYIDNMHYNTTQNKSGNYGTAPTLSDETKGEQCTGLHYKFIGWIPETDMNMTTGVPTTTANMVAGGATGKYATGINYYAIWAEEVTP